jgi:hypothetical protein
MIYVVQGLARVFDGHRYGKAPQKGLEKAEVVEVEILRERATERRRPLANVLSEKALNQVPPHERLPRSP